MPVLDIADIYIHFVGQHCYVLRWSMDFYKIIATIIAILSISFNFYQYARKKPKFKFQMSYGDKVNSDGEGTYLVAKLFISNIGGAPAIFNGLEGRDSKNEIFFPSSGASSGEKIEPNDSLVVYILPGYLLTNGTSKLYVVDGVFRKHRIPQKILRRLLRELENEKVRLESLGIKVNPPSLFERHNESRKMDTLKKRASS